MPNLMGKISFILCLFISLTSIQCKKEKTSLPPETQEGKNTFGCFVNGKIFVPKGGGLRSNRDSYYQQIYQGPNGFVFHVAGADLSTASIVYDVNINCDSINISENKVYKLTNSKKGNSVGAYMIISSTASSTFNEYTTTADLTGELFIKKFDQVKHIVAGTFWFTAINSSGDSAKITDGRFDMKFTQ
jgi:hypothetical protein